MKYVVIIICSIISSVYATVFNIEPKMIIGIFANIDFEQTAITIGYWGLGLLSGLIVESIKNEY